MNKCLFTPKQDRLIVELFPVMDTEKLSTLINLSAENIIHRYRYLKNDYEQKRKTKMLVLR